MEVIEWYKYHVLPCSTRRKIGFWVVGDEAPSADAPTDGRVVVSLDDFRSQSAQWPLTKEAHHPIILSAFE